MTEHPLDSSPTVSHTVDPDAVDWDGRLTDFIAAFTGARQAKAAARVELNRRRAAGLARRHAAKLARLRTQGDRADGGKQ